MLRSQAQCNLVPCGAAQNNAAQAETRQGCAQQCKAVRSNARQPQPAQLNAKQYDAGGDEATGGGRGRDGGET
eukprot:4565854-Pyramimonas_sp.AAC.1